MEFVGEVIEDLSVEARLTICNMAIEAGGKSGIINPDDKTLEYVKSHSAEAFTVYRSDSDAVLCPDDGNRRFRVGTGRGCAASAEQCQICP
jgi:homoaconitase/3-isopropylmalate dehydratase large subunit